MTILHARVTEDSYNGDILLVLLQLCIQPLNHLGRASQRHDLLCPLFRFLFIEDITQLHGGGSHALHLFLHGLWIELENGGFDPDRVVVLEVSSQSPQVFERFDHILSFFEFGEFSDAAQLKKLFVFVDLLHR